MNAMARETAGASSRPGSAAGRCLPLATLLLLLAGASPPVGTAAWTRESVHEALNPVFVNRMAEFYVAGAAIAVVHGGRTVYVRGWGSAEVFEPRPVIPERTIFRIGSVSKVVTGVAVLQLVDRGLLDLDADVNRYLTALQVPDTFPEPVRVRDLLTHTAGFDQLGYGRHATSREEVQPLAAFLAGNLVRLRPPGVLATYDTYGITLAGYLVEVVSGQPFEEYLQEHVFGPLEMRRTSITVPASRSADAAVGYEFRGEWFPQEWEFMNTDPASSVNSTVTDMANFAAMLLAGGEFRGHRILSEASARAMLRRQFGNDPRIPGFGFTFWEDRTFGVEAFSHGGSMTGYGCLLYLVPQHDVGVFVAYNQESDRLGNAAIEALVRSFLPGARSGAEVLPTLQGPVDVSPFAGTYAESTYNHTRPELGGWRKRPFVIIAGGDGNLHLGDQTLRPVDRLVFQGEDGPLLVFREDTDGRVTHLLVRQKVYERLPDPPDPPDAPEDG